MKKLYRSDNDKIVAGLVGGVAEYAGIDSTALRLAWLIILVFTGFVPGIIVYLLALLIVPPSPHKTHTSEASSKNSEPGAQYHP